MLEISMSSFTYDSYDTYDLMSSTTIHSVSYVRTYYWKKIVKTVSLFL